MIYARRRQRGRYGRSMKSSRPCFQLAAFILLAAHVVAADPTTPKRAITAEDLRAVKRPAALDLSRDGTRLVYNVQEYNVEKNDSQKHLWILDTATGVSRALTTAESTDNTPMWSPDGARIAFTSKRAGDEQPSLYIIRADGGEAEKVLELPLP